MRFRAVPVWWAILTCSCAGTEPAPDELLAARVTALEQDLQRVQKQRDDCLFETEILNADLAARRDKDMPERVKAVRRAMGLRIGQGLTAVFQTKLGDVRCKLAPEWAPETVRNFVELAEGRKSWTDSAGKSQTGALYPGTSFHRVVPGVLIQGGDPKNDGTGGPGFAIIDEIHEKFDRPGMLAMANHGRNTAGSQFFITLEPSPHLDGKYTIFGECDLGVARKIASQPASPEGRPETPVVIDAVRVERG